MKFQTKSPPFEGGVARSAGVVARCEQPPRLAALGSPPSKGGDFSCRILIGTFLLLMAVSIPCSAQTSDDFFNGDVLHEIRIYISPADYNTFHATNFICEQQDIEPLEGVKLSPLPRIECHFPIEFHWFFNGRDVTGPQVAISSHGKGSRSNIKPSFKIEFSRYESQNTFLGMRNLVLRADTQDASLMHERLAMTLFRKIGIPAPREVHARVYVNDQYAGVYTM